MLNHTQYGVLREWKEVNMVMWGSAITFCSLSAHCRPYTQRRKQFSVSFVLPASFCNRFLKGRRTANHLFEPGPSLVGRVWCLCSESSLPYRVSLLLFSDLLQKAHLGRVLLRAGLATLLYLHQDRCQTKACPQVYNQPFSVEKKTPGSSLEPPSLGHLV